MSNTSFKNNVNKKPKAEIRESNQKIRQSQELSESVFKLQDDEEYPPLGKQAPTKTASKSHHPVEVNDFAIYPNQLFFPFFFVLLESGILRTKTRNNE